MILADTVDEVILFSPLKKDADMTLSAEERQIEGPGIFYVSKSLMDAVDYE